MTRMIKGVVGAFKGAAVTHEGAAAFDLSAEDPLLHLVFTKGAALFAKSFYRTQSAEVFAYAQALVAAEKKERGFGWKFAAYMRDPKKGKGNRIQGSMAPAILSAADPDGPFTAEYVEKCLRHRADDVALFASHFVNLGLDAIPEAAKRGMAAALASMDEYQILKYSTRQFPLLTLRENGRPKSLRLVDAMGIARNYLPPPVRALYDYLKAPTREKDRRAEPLPLTSARRRFFKSGTAADFANARLTTEQLLSSQGSTELAWRRLLDVPGLLPDVAFKQYVRAMAAAGIPVPTLVKMAEHRRFAGLWPHQIYMGYRATRFGVSRNNFSGQTVFHRPGNTELAPVFEAILSKTAENLLPKSPCLGITDISGSMFGATIGGEKSSANVGDAALILAALMSKELGYAATFSDDIFLLGRQPQETTLDYAEHLRGGQGWGSTQVAGSMVSLIEILLAKPHLARPRTLFFFSDMQFHPPELQKLPDKKTLPAELRFLFQPHVPPLAAAIHAYRRLLGPVDVVLWNLAAYDNAPLPSNMEGVLMLAGFDANTFRHVETWQNSGSPAISGQISTAPSPKRDNAAELHYIRTF